MLDCWQKLNINATKNIKEIKKAYALLLKKHNPEDDPQGYQELRKAYDEAIKYAKSNDKVKNQDNINTTTINSTTEFDDYENTIKDEDKINVNNYMPPIRFDINTIDINQLFNEKLNEIYNSPQLRFSKEAWINLLNYPQFQNFENQQLMETQLIYFIMKHSYLSYEIYQLLNNNFSWTNRCEEIKFNYSVDISNFLVDKITNTPNILCSSLTNIDISKLDDFLELRESAYIAANEQNEEVIDIIRNLLNIYKDDSEVYRILGLYNLLTDNNKMAKRAFEKSLDLDSFNYFSLYHLGILYAKEKRFKESQKLLAKALKLNNFSSLDNDEEFTYYYGLSNYYENSFIAAKKYFEKYQVFQPESNIVKKYLKSIDNNIKFNKTKKINYTVISIKNSIINFFKYEKDDEDKLSYIFNLSKHCLKIVFKIIGLLLLLAIYVNFHIGILLTIYLIYIKIKSNNQKQEDLFIDVM